MREKFIRTGSFVIVGLLLLNMLVGGATLTRAQTNGTTANLLQASGSKLTDGSTLTNGLITYWTMNGQDINWTAGKMYDKSTAGNTATLNNLTSASAVTSRIGQALTFNGTNQYLRGSQTVNIANVTESIWVRYSSNPAASKVITSFFDTNSSYDKALLLNSAGTVTWYVFDGAGKNVTSAKVITDGKWHHLVGTADGSNSRLYIDGVSAGSTPAGATYTGYVSPDVMVNGTNSAYSYSAGSEDDFRLYNRALSTSEITQLYQLGLGTTAQASTAKLSDGSTLGAGSTNGTSNGLVGWWTMDGQDINWTAGKMYDKSGTVNTGTLVNLTTASSAVGKMGQALSFNGSNNYVRVPYSSSINPSGDFTVSAWAKTNVVNSAYHFVLDQGGSGCNDPNYQLRLSSANHWSFNYSNSVGSNSTANQAGTPVAGVWYHLVGVRLNNVSYLYVNGVLAGTGSTVSGTFTNAKGLIIGAQSCDGTVPNGNYFNGSIDDVHVYNRALSTTEITQLYQQGAGVTAQASSAKLTDGSTVGKGSTNGTSNGLIAHWTFDGQDTNWGLAQSYDKSGNNNTAAMTSMTAALNAGIGILGQGLKFNGTGNNKISVADSTSLDTYGTTHQLTVSAWVKFNGFYTGACGGNQIAIKGVDSALGGFRFMVQDTATAPSPTGSCFSSWGGPYVLWFGVKASGSYTYGDVAAGSIPIQKGKWYHLVGVYDGSTARTYVNGVADNTAAVTGTLGSNTSPLTIGWMNVGGYNYPLNGTIDDLRIYDRALSASEIMNLYQVGR